MCDPIIHTGQDIEKWLKTTLFPEVQYVFYFVVCVCV